MSNSLDSDHVGCFAVPDLGSNCLQWLSADTSSKQRVNDAERSSQCYFRMWQRWFNAIDVVSTLIFLTSFLNPCVFKYINLMSVTDENPLLRNYAVLWMCISLGPLHITLWEMEC